MTLEITKNDLRHRNNDGIQISEELKRYFPAIFNEKAGGNVTEGYQLYPSHQIIDQFQDAGMSLVEVAQERVGRSKLRRPETQIHSMRFRDQRATAQGFGIGDSVPEILIMNNHDGRFRFRAHCGVFRFVCHNGIVAVDEEMGGFKQTHFGKKNTFAMVQELLTALPESLQKVSNEIEGWDVIRLTALQQRQLAMAMMKDRVLPAWVRPSQLLEAAREEDAADSDGKRSLWLTFNVLQESLTSRRIKRLPVEGQSEVGFRGSSLRPVNGAYSNFNANKSFWSTAREFSKLATGEIMEKTHIDELSGAELVAMHNKYCRFSGAKPVKKFSDTSTARKRVEKVLTLQAA